MITFKIFLLSQESFLLLYTLCALQELRLTLQELAISTKILATN